MDAVSVLKSARETLQQQGGIERHCFYNPVTKTRCTVSAMMHAVGTNQLLESYQRSEFKHAMRALYDELPRYNAHPFDETSWVSVSTFNDNSTDDAVYALFDQAINRLISATR